MDIIPCTLLYMKKNQNTISWGHQTSMWWSQDLNPGTLAPEFMLLNAFIFSIHLTKSGIRLIFMKTCDEHEWPFRNCCFYFLFSIAKSLLRKNGFGFNAGWHCTWRLDSYTEHSSKRSTSRTAWAKQLILDQPELQREPVLESQN